jgi:hypothetical protein
MEDAGNGHGNGGQGNTSTRWRGDPSAQCANKGIFSHFPRACVLNYGNYLAYREMLRHQQMTEKEFSVRVSPTRPKLSAAFPAAISVTTLIAGAIAAAPPHTLDAILRAFALAPAIV